jgi:hypothetical protein
VNIYKWEVAVGRAAAARIRNERKEAAVHAAGGKSEMLKSLSRHRRWS